MQHNLAKIKRVFGPRVASFQVDANLQMQEKQQRLVSKMTTKLKKKADEAVVREGRKRSNPYK